MASESSDVTEFRAVCVRQPPQSIDLSCEESADDLGTFDSPCWQSERMRFGIPHNPNSARISFEVSMTASVKNTPGLRSLRPEPSSHPVRLTVRLPIRARGKWLDIFTYAAELLGSTLPSDGPLKSTHHHQLIFLGFAGAYLTCGQTQRTGAEGYDSYRA